MRLAYTSITHPAPRRQPERFGWLHHLGLERREVKLAEVLGKARTIMDGAEDSLILLKSRTQQWLEKQMVGHERSPLDTIL